jgi:hypothetical protein
VGCGITPYRYAILSRLKYEVSRYHLSQFERVLEMFPQIALLRPIGDQLGVSPIYAHSDGCVFQLYGAFDAFACAFAHRFGFPDAERASFARSVDKRLAPQWPEDLEEADSLRDEIREVVESERFGHLEELRNLASHRGVVVRYLVADRDPGIKAFFTQSKDPAERGPEVLSELQEVVNWALTPLLNLWDVAEEWREPGEYSVEGTLHDIEMRLPPAEEPPQASG